MASAVLKRALESASEVGITVTGRSSGREISILVWLVLEDDKVYLLPVRGSEADWYRNVRKTPMIRLTANDARGTAKATPVVDPARVSEVVDKFRAKYGADDVARYYKSTDVAVEVSLD
jgi:hypothetical protein